MGLPAEKAKADAVAAAAYKASDGEEKEGSVVSEVAEITPSSLAAEKAPLVLLAPSSPTNGLPPRSGSVSPPCLLLRRDLEGGRRATSAPHVDEKGGGRIISGMSVPTLSSSSSWTFPRLVCPEACPDRPAQDLSMGPPADSPLVATRLEPHQAVHGPPTPYNGTELTFRLFLPPAAAPLPPQTAEGLTVDTAGGGATGGGMESETKTAVLQPRSDKAKDVQHRGRFTIVKG